MDDERFDDFLEWFDGQSSDTKFEVVRATDGIRGYSVHGMDEYVGGCPIERLPQLMAALRQRIVEEVRHANPKAQRKGLEEHIGNAFHVLADYLEPLTK